MSSASTAAADAAAFHPVEMIRRFQICRASLDAIPLHEFVAGCNEVKKIVYTIGSAFSIASSDITEKTEVLTKRCSEMEATAAGGAAAAAPAAAAAAGGAGGDASATITLQSLVLSEIARKVQAENSSKFVSGARSLLRLMWFLDFLTEILRKLVAKDSEETLKACVTTAYESALAPHHSWIFRTTIIYPALYFLPTKAVFLKNLSPTATSEDLIIAQLTEFIAIVDPVRKALWDFYEAHKLKELP